MQRTESGPCAGTRCPLFLCREVIGFGCRSMDTDYRQLRIPDRSMYRALLAERETERKARGRAAADHRSIE